jgi:hypothetical protein
MRHTYTKRSQGVKELGCPPTARRAAVFRNNRSNCDFADARLPKLGYHPAIMAIPDSSAPAAPAFQKCGSCGRRWGQWQEFVMDPGIRLLGMQVNFSLPESNLFVFEHDCGSSVSVLARRLRSCLQVAEPQGAPNRFGSEQCGGHCTKLEDLEACDRDCANAADRKLIQMLLAMKSGRS